MSEPDFTNSLKSSQVAIIGVGLIGGSLAYALKGKCDRLLGLDTDPRVVAAAQELDLFDAVASDLHLILPQADFLILATPVRQIINLLGQLPQLHPGTPVVLDTGSTKGDVAAALGELPSRFHPVGGHPMAGKEVGGFSNASPDLFQDTPFTLVKIRDVPSQLIDLVESLVRQIGARPVWLNAEAHDQIAADISHLPYLIASALAHATPHAGSSLAGSGFRSTTRLASTSPGMMMDVIRTNRSHILNSLVRYQNELNTLEALLTEGKDGQFQEWLQESRTRRAEILGLEEVG